MSALAFTSLIEGCMKWFGQRDKSQHCKTTSVAGKIVITAKKLIAPLAWIFDSEHVTVVAFSAKTPVKAQTTQSRPPPFIQYLFQSLTHMLIVSSHLHHNDFTLPFYHLSDLYIRISAAHAPSVCLCRSLLTFLSVCLLLAFRGGYLAPIGRISIVYSLIC